MTAWNNENDKTNPWSVLAKSNYYVVHDYCVDDYVEIDEIWENESDKATTWQSL